MLSRTMLLTSSILLVAISSILLARYCLSSGHRYCYASVLISTILISTVAFKALRSSSPVPAKRSTELYGTSHSLLNAPDSTLWQNMGFWTNSCTFRQACENLTDLVASSIDPSDTVLDFGYGCGEEIKYIAEKYKPLSIRGCTSHQVQNDIARELCRGCKSVTLTHGDALQWCLDYHGDPVSCVVAIDTVYHFNTRLKFLKSLGASCMKPGSRLILADIILSERHGQASRSRLPWYHLDPVLYVLRMLSVPWQNMRSRQEYIQDLKSAGFTNIDIQVITHKVFPGLARYIESRADWRKDKKWIGFMLFAKILRWWSEERHVEFIITKASLADCPSDSK